MKPITQRGIPLITHLQHCSTTMQQHRCTCLKNTTDAIPPPSHSQLSHSQLSRCTHCCFCWHVSQLLPSLKPNDHPYAAAAAQLATADTAVLPAQQLLLRLPPLPPPPLLLLHTGDPLWRLCFSLAMALPGLRPLGQVWLQFMMVCGGSSNGPSTEPAHVTHMLPTCYTHVTHIFQPSALVTAAYSSEGRLALMPQLQHTAS